MSVLMVPRNINISHHWCWQDWELHWRIHSVPLFPSMSTCLKEGQCQLAWRYSLLVPRASKAKRWVQLISQLLSVYLLHLITHVWSSFPVRALPPPQKITPFVADPQLKNLESCCHFSVLVSLWCLNIGLHFQCVLSKLCEFLCWMLAPSSFKQ